MKGQTAKNQLSLLQILNERKFKCAKEAVVPKCFIKKLLMIFGQSSLATLLRKRLDTGVFL